MNWHFRSLALGTWHLALGAWLLAPGTFLFAPCFPPRRNSQQLHRVGVLSPRLGIEAREEKFRQTLRELGYIEGQNLVIDWRFAKGKMALLPELAAELIRLKPDCLVVSGADPAKAAKQATQTIPIVMSTIDADPVQLGLIASLARPGGNITGFTGMAYDIAGKRLELLKESVPKASRVAILVDPGLAAQAHVTDSEAAARVLKLQLQTIEVRQPEELDHAFQLTRQRHAEMLSVVATGLINSHRSRIVKLAAAAGLPTIYSALEFIPEGGLMSYSTDLVAQNQRVAGYVDRILKGTKPADLPVQQPTAFQFIVNLKAAKQIGLTIPPNVLARADRVIR